MKDHVPDLERCRRLKEMGFGQYTLLSWKIATDSGRNDKPFVEWGRFNTADAVSVCAAPIVTELVGEIRKFAKPQESEMLVPVIEMYLSEMGDWNVGSVAQFQITDEADYCNADTLPNALADLWIWLREREPGSNCL